MRKKRIFNKKYKFINFLKLILILIALVISIYFYYIFTNEKFFILPSFKDKYYIIPKDKGGEKVLNLDKKSLHLNHLIINNNKLSDTSDLLFSIQFFSSSDFDEIKLTVMNLVNNYENLYKKEDFYVVAFQSELGIDYFLLYKNFKNSTEAYNHCSKYVSHIENCLIVNVQNF